MSSLANTDGIGVLRGYVTAQEMCAATHEDKLAAGSEGLQECDEVPLVVVAQFRLFSEELRTEVVTSIHDIVRALAKREQAGNEVSEDPPGIVVGWIVRKGA